MKPKMGLFVGRWLLIVITMLAVGVLSPGNAPTAGKTPANTPVADDLQRRTEAADIPSVVSTPATPSAWSTRRVGTDYYVDSVNGNDGNVGTSSSAPWRSLAPINARSFGPGDTINLARGSAWSGSGGASTTLSIHGGGASGSPITLQPYGSGSAPVISNPNSQPGSRGVSIQAPHVVVQGLLVRDVQDTGIQINANNAVVQYNELTQVGIGVAAQSQYNLITNNYAHDLTMVVNDVCQSDGTGCDNDYGAEGVAVRAANNEVSHNRFVHCSAFSYDYGTDGGAVEIFGVGDNSMIHDNYPRECDGFMEVGGGSARNVTVAYNVTVNSGRVVGIHLGGKFASVADNFLFTNNTVVDTATSTYQAFFRDDGASTASTFIMRNNIFYLNDFKVVMEGSPTFTHDHNLYYLQDPSTRLGFPPGPGEQLGDPQFVDLAAEDFRRRPGSPAIDAGTQGAHRVDFAGQLVPAGKAVDLGAYEFGEALADR